MKRALIAFVLLLAGCAGQGTTLKTLPPTNLVTTTAVSPEVNVEPGDTPQATIPGTTGSTTTSPRAPASVTTSTTTPAVGQLLVIGDFGTGGSAEYAVADAMRTWAATHDVAAILTTGDDLYTSNVEKAWTNPFGWIAEAGIPVWTTWGNHDNQRPNAVQAAFNDPPRWSKHSWGDVTVLSLDSTDVASGGQEQWLASVLSNTLAPVIVAEHYPAYSCSFHGDSRAVQQDWAPRFQQAGVELVLSGHEHNYQRFEVGGVEYVVTGGGGAGLYPLKTCPSGHPTRIAGDAAHHFLAVSQNSHGLHVQVVSSDGMIDEFDVERVIGGLPTLGHWRADYQRQ